VADFLTVDANVLVYSQDPRDPRKRAIAISIIAGLHGTTARLLALTLGEFFNVTARKFIPALDARRRVEDFMTLAPVLEYSSADILRAAREVEAGRFAFWDAVMLAAAERAGCVMCLSEDMADGARLGAVVVRNPFGPRGITPEIRARLKP
jgi:predicted nucleic acid-binding protein